jgi:phosphoglycolate phosphatase-like HAD superfamily hydrolase
LKDALHASHNHFGKKFSKNKTFVIGDTKHDVVAAHALKLKSVGVDTGSTLGRDFIQIRPHHRFSDFSDLDAFVRLFKIQPQF